MSAILGVFYLDGRPVRGADLDQMVHSVVHRGPDGSSTWHRGSIGLGHAMLWTTPESLSEKQPLTTWDGTKVIVADARIDNRDELQRAIGVDAPRRREMSDSELILAAYEKWGENCPERLLGDYAFAVWDSVRSILFCARDPFGVKPLYFHFQPGRIFAFASGIKALLSLQEVPRRLNELRVADYLVGSFDHSEITFFRDIERLAPASCITVDMKQVRSRTFWSLDGLQPAEPRSDGEYAEALRERFETAVRCRLRSAFPVGSLLSGGLDSSAVTCMADTLRDRHNGHPLHTFSFVFDAVPECDERFYIDKVLSARSVQGHFVNGDTLSPFTEVERLLWYQDEPLLYPTLPLDLNLYATAKASGVRVVLHGNGGDTVLSHGEMQIAALARSGQWIAVARGLGGLSRNLNKTYLEALTRYLIAPSVPKAMQKLSWRVFGRPRKSADSIINAAFANRIGLEERRQKSAALRKAPTASSNEYHIRALKQGSLRFLLEARDRCAAPNSVDPRYPFYDSRLVELCASLPGSQKLHDGWTRIAMRRAMEGILPKEIQWRNHKTPVVAHPLKSLLKSDKARLEELLNQGSEELDKYVNRSALHEAHHRLIALQNSGNVMSGWHDAVGLWRVAVLSLWLRSSGVTH